jgi:hypothetical protein
LETWRSDAKERAMLLRCIRSPHMSIHIASLLALPGALLALRQLLKRSRRSFTLEIHCSLKLKINHGPLD